MKKTLLLAGILLAASATVASAGLLNLGWGAFCPTNPGSLPTVSDPCDGSSGAVYTLIGSVTIAAPAPTDVVAEDFFVDLQEAAAQLSDYWHLEDENQPGQVNAAGCRGMATVGPFAGNSSSLLVQASNVAFPALFTGCQKFWGTAFGGVNYGVLIPDGYPGIVDPRKARIIGHFARTPGAPMVNGVQYGSFVASIDTNHQNGIDGAYPAPKYVCQGCQDAVCLVFNETIIYQTAGTPGGDQDITTGGQRNFVTWQSATGTDCPGPTPTHKATWGKVKSLYR
jgi:hypothetical protein